MCCYGRGWGRVLLGKGAGVGVVKERDGGGTRGRGVHRMKPLE